MGYATTAIGDLEGFCRDVRGTLGLSAFGMSAFVLPPGTEQAAHFHTRQDEVYVVLAGKAGFEIDGETLSGGPGTIVMVESTTPRQFWNAGEEDLTLIAVGAQDGYVEGDAELVDPDDAARVAAMNRSDADGIRRRPRT